MIKATSQFGWDTAKVWALTGLSAASILTIALLLRNGAAGTPSQAISPVSFSQNQTQIQAPADDRAPSAFGPSVTDRVK